MDLFSRMLAMQVYRKYKIRMYIEKVGKIADENNYGCICTTIPHIDGLELIALLNEVCKEGGYRFTLAELDETFFTQHAIHVRIEDVN